MIYIYIYLINTISDTLHYVITLHISKLSWCDIEIINK